MCYAINFALAFSAVPGNSTTKGTAIDRTHPVVTLATVTVELITGPAPRISSDLPVTLRKSWTLSFGLAWIDELAIIPNM